MSRTSWIKFYADDFLAGINELAADERGTYITLLAMMWSKGQGLTNDDSWLGRQCNVSTRMFKKHKVALIKQGKISIENDKIINDRALNEFKTSQESREKYSESGVKGGLKSAEKRREMAENSQSSTSNATTNASTNQNQNQILDKSNKDTICRDAISHYNSLAENNQWPACQKLSETRKKSLTARVGEAGGLDQWKQIISDAAESDYLTGKVKPWAASIDFFLRASSFLKVMEGQYKNRGTPKQSSFLTEDGADWENTTTEISDGF